MLAPAESAPLAQRLITDTFLKQRIEPGQLWRAAIRIYRVNIQHWRALLLADLGVTKTHSRLYTSDDNPFSEAQFKTMRYRSDFPERFRSLEEARAFCQRFFPCDNSEHHHAGIGLMLLAAVHKGWAELIHQDRHQVLMTAYTAHPERFISQPPPSLRLPRATWGYRLFRRRVDSDGTGTTIASGADLQGIHNSEGIGTRGCLAIRDPGSNRRGLH